MSEVLTSLQFFLGTADDDVHQYLKFFTFESLQNLQELINEHEKFPHKRLAQHTLALNVLRLVHGEEKAQRARDEHSRLFQSLEGYSTASIREIAMAVQSPTDEAPKDKSSVNMTLPSSKILKQSISQVLQAAGLVASRSEGRRLCASNGVYVGVMLPSEEDAKFKWQPVSEISKEAFEDVGRLVIDRDLLFLRAGKTKIRAIVVTDAGD